MNDNTYTRTTEKELKYFGSDFNKYLHSLSKEMTVINIDTIQLKRSKKKMRIIEFKHTTESDPDREEYEVLSLFDLFFKFIGMDRDIICKSTYDWDVNVYIVRGDSPFEKLVVKNISTGKTKVLSGNEVKQWCEFEIDF